MRARCGRLELPALWTACCLARRSRAAESLRLRPVGARSTARRARARRSARYSLLDTASDRQPPTYGSSRRLGRGTATGGPSPNDFSCRSAAAQQSRFARSSRTHVGCALAPDTLTISELREVTWRRSGHDVSATPASRALRAACWSVSRPTRPGPRRRPPAALFRVACPPPRGRRVRGAQCRRAGTSSLISRQRLKRQLCVTSTSSASHSGAALESRCRSPSFTTVSRSTHHKRDRRVHVGHFEPPRPRPLSDSRAPQALRRGNDSLPPT